MHMQQQLDTADQFITEFSTGSAEARVARLLLFLESTSTGVYCELLGREEMASILGITTETASRIMADFRRRGLVSGVINSSFSCHHAQLQQIALDM
ncbi:bacterial regulatory protein, crp family [mine drainage metagenome]|uniref:Bacterial regulatory protein, crp family n=1 Tax=mine drainage metagenome TaxID=410659 RepID=A0A1J5QDV8_9ZZZZ